MRNKVEKELLKFIEQITKNSEYYDTLNKFFEIAKILNKKLNYETIFDLRYIDKNYLILHNQDEEKLPRYIILKFSEDIQEIGCGYENIYKIIEIGFANIIEEIGEILNREIHDIFIMDILDDYLEYKITENYMDEIEKEIFYEDYCSNS